MRILTGALGALLLLTALVFGGVGHAAAQSDELNIPAGTVIYGSEGDVIELGRIPVDRSLAGPLCTWEATATNQASVHPGSDILIESNGTTLVLADVEATPNKVTTNSGSVALADEVVVSLRLGPDGRFSGRMTVAINYSNCPPETTTTEATTTTTEATTSTEATTTTAEATTTTTEATTTETTGPAGPDVSQTEPPTTAAPTTTASPTTAPTTADTTAGTTDALPVTGSSLTPVFVLAGALLVLIGLGLSATTRRST